MGLLGGGGGGGRVTFNLHLGVGHSVLCQWKGWVMCFLTTTFSNALPPSPPPVLFDQSLTNLDKGSLPDVCIALSEY